ncbi:MAG: hypothetical protein JW725_02560 [Candidatus Babeliaceae bacterium]|nr:hypothetical protein [Candidatus Babeliaceae bacterium]
MIVERVTYFAKPGKIEEAVELLKSMRDSLENPEKLRIYRFFFAPNNKISWEWELESVSVLGETMDKILARPEMAEWLKKLGEVMESGGTDEIYILVE